MNNQNTIISILLLVTLTQISCSTYPYSYHYHPTNDFMSTRKIAIMPFNLLSQNKYSNNRYIINSSIEAIINELQNMKFEYIEGTKINNVIDSLKNAFVNFYDAKTGKLDTSILHKFIDTSNKVLIEKYGVTSILYPYLIVAPAIINNSTFLWHGRAYVVFSQSGRGQASALSLYVRIYDKNQEMIFDNAGGIQPLDKIYFNGFKEIDEKELLKNPNDIIEAVNIVFKPIKEEIAKKKK